jgi:hypothetical protein
MREVENRIKRLEMVFLDKPSAVQFLIVPREMPWEKRGEYIRERSDGRPMVIIAEGLPLDECMAKHGVVEITTD